MLPEDVREWEMVATTHHGEYTRVTIASKPVDENSAQMRLILFNGLLGQEEDEDGDGDGGEEPEGDGDSDEGGDEPEEPVEEPYEPTVAAFYNLLGDEWELIYINENVPNAVSYTHLTLPTKA